MAGAEAASFGQPGTTMLTPLPNSTNYSEAYRQFYLDDRNRSQAKFQIDIDVLRNFTVTPTINIRNDGFLLTTERTRSDQGQLNGRRARTGLCRHARPQVPVLVHE